MYPKVPLNPTIVPVEDFDPRADAEVLRNAMKGFGTDEGTIISTITNRSREQRQEIALEYKTLYGRDLLEDLRSELSGNFRKTIIALMTPLMTYYAEELHNAIAGLGTNENTLIDILVTLSNNEISAVKEEYKSLYKNLLEDDIIGDTSGYFKRFLVSLLCGNRSESYDVDISSAQEDAENLYAAGEEHWGTDEATFNSIMATRSPMQLGCIIEEYAKLTNHEIEKAIESEFSGDIKNVHLAILKYVRNRSEFFAERLYKSMKGLGTDDNTLIRIIVSRSEIDLAEIKDTFRSLYGEPLEDWIKGDCSGDYKKCLLNIIS